MTASGSARGNDAQHVGEGAVVLATKLHVPAVRDGLIHRSNLLDALRTTDSRKVTLVSAPAGWGKTTLLAQWLADVACHRHDQRYGWLSLDPPDNDPVRFWRYVISALQTASPGVGARALELLDMGAPPLQAVLPTLLNELAVITDRIVLVLDDYHLVINPAVHEQMTFLISHMATNLHVVVATRSDPVLPLARLRARGDLMEVRTGDLRFATTETDQLLNDVLDLDLSEADIELLCQRTEGWAAGLYLAALSLAGRANTQALIRTFAGDNRHIVDYLMAEVLDGQSPARRTFLLRTSILRRLSGTLCDAVLQERNSGAVLEAIERENLFLVPLDSTRRWYRYHHLFAELLRTELYRCEPDALAGLHQRAAAWLEHEGLIDATVRHLSEAGDLTRAAELIAANWVTEFNAGGLSTVSGWLDLLPSEIVVHDPRLSVARSWIAQNEGRISDAAFWIDAVQTAAFADTSIEAQAVVLSAIQSFKLGDISGALWTAQRAITLDLGDAPLARSGVFCIYGNTLYYSGRIDDAEASYRRAVQRADEIGDRRYRIYALGYLALIAAERGQFALAEQQIRRANGGGTDLAAEEYFVGVMVSLAAATVLDKHGQVAAAADAVEMALNSARQGGAIPEIAKALLAKAGILEHLGDHPSAAQARTEATTLLARSADATIGQTLLISEHPSTTVSAGSPPYGAGEELTPKELEVLGLLATRLSRREIGQRLYVSLNTVKSHQRSLYRKLGVDDRSSAAKAARDLGLL